MIRIDQVWLAVDPIDMRCGLDTALAKVVNVFGAAHPHHAYLFANKRGNRLKVPLGCRPDSVRVRSLTDSVRAANRAAAGQPASGAMPRNP